MVERPTSCGLPIILLSHVFCFLLQCCIETVQKMVKNKSLLSGQASPKKTKTVAERQAARRRLKEDQNQYETLPDEAKRTDEK